MLESDKRLGNLLLRMQARFRGVIVRTKFRKGGIDEMDNLMMNNNKFIPRNPYGTSKPIKEPTIVS